MTYSKTKWTNADETVVTIYRGNGAIIGDDARIGDGATIGNYAKIGNYATIGNGDKCEFPLYIAPLPFGPTNYYVTATKTNLAIGCVLKPIEWWANASDSDILELDGKNALKYWRVAKSLIFALMDGCGYMPQPVIVDLMK
ncbi:MAG: hypothetical protein ACEQSB_00110 [Undibacterium sp.]